MPHLDFINSKNYNPYNNHIFQHSILWPSSFSLVLSFQQAYLRFQAGIKIAGRNINNLRYTDDTTHMAEIEEEVKSFLLKVKEESEKVGLNVNIQKTNIMASGPITSWQKRWGNSWNSGWLYFLGLQNHCRWWLQPWNEKMLTPWKESYDQPR